MKPSPVCKSLPSQSQHVTSLPKENMGKSTATRNSFSTHTNSQPVTHGFRRRKANPSKSVGSKHSLQPSDWGFSKEDFVCLSLRSINPSNSIPVIGRMIKGLYDFTDVPDFHISEDLPVSSPPSFCIHFPKGRLDEFLALWCKGIHPDIRFQLCFISELSVTGSSVAREPLVSDVSPTPGAMVSHSPSDLSAASPTQQSPDRQLHTSHPYGSPIPS